MLNVSTHLGRYAIIDYARWQASEQEGNRIQRPQMQCQCHRSMCPCKHPTHYTTATTNAMEKVKVKPEPIGFITSHPPSWCTTWPQYSCFAVPGRVAWPHMGYGSARSYSCCCSSCIRTCSSLASQSVSSNRRCRTLD